jgi:hypothetical protein
MPLAQWTTEYAQRTCHCAHDGVGAAAGSGAAKSWGGAARRAQKGLKMLLDLRRLQVPFTTFTATDFGTGSTRIGRSRQPARALEPIARRGYFACTHRLRGLPSRAITRTEMTDMQDGEVAKRLHAIDTQDGLACKRRHRYGARCVGDEMPGRSPGFARVAIIALLAAALAGCSAMDRREPTQPAATERGCTVAGQFCNTFFGP